jgi:hypothetical protein
MGDGMSLSMEMQDFCDGWLAKADSYNGGSINDYYNKAFSLFAVYNRLYCEATFTLARVGSISLPADKPFPDGKGAKEYAPQFIGFDALLAEFENDPSCTSAIDTLDRLIDKEAFHFKLSMPFGQPQRDKDLQLLQKLRSNVAKTRVMAIMDVLYSVRCNMVHGNKRFAPVQIQVLHPVTTLLRKVSVVLYDKLKIYVEHVNAEPDAARDRGGTRASRGSHSPSRRGR